ncbi:LOW QUALITY PROTEIN: reverse transcriptase [Phytophthora megakarya]|uniref:Reverse transcriptase n=1 Tax=Phytophthora megakarya TaxID=4795 RepID=A0A225V2S1_9STRA|nr:LOW QUALITY PROTEIN: reverse transcriptase [Phytophthora megakarya]
MISHDQDPRFMSKVFARFRDLLKSKQRATLGYRPQANGQQKRSVQTRMSLAEVDQSDWNEHAERLMFELNTSLDTPFYLVHGWDAQGTISAMLGPKPSTVQERTALEWRRKMQRDYSYALACAEDLQKKAKRVRSAAQTRKWRELSDRVKAGFEAGDSVWLYIPMVCTGLSLSSPVARAFPNRRNFNDFRVKLKIPGTGYRVNPWVSEDDDFDAALLPEVSWEPDTAQDEYEVEEILDLSGNFHNYPDPEWIPLAQLNCGALLYEFDQGAKARARFQAMQAGDDHPGN